MAESGEQALFPPPPQPYFIRAQQKDELYLQVLTDACHDAVRRVLGPRSALRWADETRAAAQLLYYALTTGAGLQTLGEEYCDMLQASGPVGRSALPGPARRGLLVLLQAVGPYLADRLAAAAPAEEGEEEDGFVAWRRAQAEAAAAAAQQQRQEQQGQEAPPGRPRQLVQGAADLAQRLRATLQLATAPALRRLPTVAAFVRDHAGTLLRLHLAMFYLFGAYYQPSKRATGVRYLFLGRALEGRPSYHVLGLLLCTQLAVSGLLWLSQRYGQGAALLGGAGGAGAPDAGAAGMPRHALLLSEEGKPLADGGWQAPNAAAAAARGGSVVDPAVPGSRKCPLCLSARSHPTATPCGHVFCWQCIAEWGNQKPECPLCRAEFTPPSLVCVRHADF